VAGGGKFRGSKRARAATLLVNSIFKTGSEQCPLYTSPPVRRVHFAPVSIRDATPEKIGRLMTPLLVMVH